jgi:hypothetical protein
MGTSGFELLDMRHGKKGVQVGHFGMCVEEKAALEKLMVVQG